MDDLFSASTRERSFQNAPLAVRMRPNSLDEYVGQQKAVGKGSWLRAAIEHDVLSSAILYGPAGTGKTTLAHIIANHTKLITIINHWSTFAGKHAIVRSYAILSIILMRS